MAFLESSGSVVPFTPLMVHPTLHNGGPFQETDIRRPSLVEAIASRVEAIAVKLEAIASRVEAIAINYVGGHRSSGGGHCF